MMNTDKQRNHIFAFLEGILNLFKEMVTLVQQGRIVDTTLS